jgi:ubiquinone/menaquinone biosynthesis C-methylase UbiE
MAGGQSMDATIEDLSERLIGYKTGEIVSLMVHLGLALGLYRAMAGAGVMAADEVAAKTGTHRRWVLEWLRGQTAAGLVEADGEESFRLPDEVAELMLDERSLQYAAGFFHPPLGGETVQRIAEAFRTGIGMTWEDHGTTGTHFVAGSTGPQHRLLPSEILPLLDDVVAKLEAGGTGIDVGCGSGVAITELAKAFPKASFVGVDPSPTALAEARALVSQAGVSNVELRDGTAEGLKEEDAFDLVMVLDCMHDMTHPQEAMQSIRRSIREDGSWLLKDIRSAGTLAGNLENPLAPLLYGFSVAFCMSSAMSTPDGAGTGTLGFDAATAERMARDAGFTRFRQLDYDADLFNAFYEVRP